jgi:hypothetical protein
MILPNSLQLIRNFPRENMVRNTQIRLTPLLGGPIVYRVTSFVEAWVFPKLWRRHLRGTLRQIAALHSHRPRPGKHHGLQGLTGFPEGAIDCRGIRQWSLRCT